MKIPGRRCELTECFHFLFSLTLKTRNMKIVCIKLLYRLENRKDGNNRLTQENVCQRSIVSDISLLLPKMLLLYLGTM